VVEQPARRRDQDLDALLELGGLRLHVHAAEHHRAAQLGVLGIERDLLGDLVGQLARGQQHQRTHRVTGRRGRGILVLEHALQQRQREGGRLAGAGLCRAHHVAALQHDRNGLRLNGGHGRETHLGDGACQRLGQRKF